MTTAADYGRWRYGRWPDDGSEVRAALEAHGYDPDLPPRGVTGGPGVFQGAKEKLRNWICVLDGIIIDGHSDPDNSGMCIFCSVDM